MKSGIAIMVREGLTEFVCVCVCVSVCATVQHGVVRRHCSLDGHWVRDSEGHLWRDMSECEEEQSTYIQEGNTHTHTHTHTQTHTHTHTHTGPNTHKHIHTRDVTIINLYTE